MANKFLSDIDLTARLRANGNEGDPGQVLSSTVSGVEWIDQASIEASSNLVYFDVKNETGSTISKGKGVMAVGTDGNSGHILIDEMVGDGNIEPKYFLGVLEEDIANGAFARVISFGMISQFNTNGQNGETWSDGQILWCDPVNAGDFTITEPDGPNVKIAAAIILNSSTNGKIQVRVQANEGVHDLHDTKITSQVDGDVLVWDDTTGVWFNDSTLNVDYTAGRVGIGTTDPSAKLHVLGDSSDDATTKAEMLSNSVFSVRPHSTNSGTLAIAQVDGGNSVGMQFTNGAGTSNWDISMQPFGGNVGIGTTDPSQKLDVSGNANIDGYLKWGQPTGGSVQYMYRGDGGIFAKQSTTANSIHSGSNYFSIRNSADNSDLVYVSNTGNVSIGTNSLSEKLEVSGNIKLTETAATTDTDKFAVLDNGVIKYRTGTQVLSDIGGAQSSEVYTIDNTDSIFTSKTLSQNISFGESYASNYRSRVLDLGGTFFPRPLGYEIGLMKEQNLFQKAKLSLLPSGVGAESLHNVKPKNDTFDFTRNSTATYVDEDGLIAVAPINTPRLNYPMIDGVVSGCPSLLLEPQRSNLVAYSEAFDNAAWIKFSNTSISDNFAISPDGTQNSSEIKATSTSTSVLGFYTGFTVSSGVEYTVSFFAKKGIAKYIQLYHAFSQVAGVPRTNFDLENGVVSVSDAGHTSSIEDYGNGWYRCIVKLTTATTILQTFFNAVKLPSAPRDAASSWSANDNFYFYGAQLEQGSYPTSYIPTNGSTVTRSAETANGSGDAATFNDSEGVLMAEIENIDGFISISDGTANNRITIGRESGQTKRLFLTASGGAIQTYSNSTDWSVGSFDKVLISYKLNDIKIFVNGFLIATDTSYSIPSGLNTALFTSGTTSGNFYGNTKQLQYFDTALTDTDLEQLTSWTSFNEMANAQQYSIL